jgi:CheY-like chemotaxis protein
VENAAVPVVHDKVTVTHEDKKAKQKKLRVLVVEDVVPNQLVARKLIEKHGHRVDIAANGFEALEAVYNRPYDLVFMDIRMPEMDGLAATRSIRERGGDLGILPIVAMTANATNEDVQQCSEAGMNDFIAKPIDNAVLKSVLEKYATEPSEKQ